MADAEELAKLKAEHAYLVGMASEDEPTRDCSVYSRKKADGHQYSYALFSGPYTWAEAEEKVDMLSSSRPLWEFKSVRHEAAPSSRVEVEVEAAATAPPGAESVRVPARGEKVRITAVHPLDCNRLNVGDVVTVNGASRSSFGPPWLVLNGGHYAAETAADDCAEGAAEAKPGAFQAVCPCALAGPCEPNCTCADPFKSGGCRCCASYGDADQRKGMAEYIFTLLRAGFEAIKAAAPVAEPPPLVAGEPRKCGDCGRAECPMLRRGDAGPALDDCRQSQHEQQVAALESQLAAAQSALEETWLDGWAASFKEGAKKLEKLGLMSDPVRVLTEALEREVESHNEFLRSHYQPFLDSLPKVTQTCTGELEEKLRAAESALEQVNADKNRLTGELDGVREGIAFRDAEQARLLEQANARVVEVEAELDRKEGAFNEMNRAVNEMGNAAADARSALAEANARAEKQAAKARWVASRLLDMYWLYANYRVDSRGPVGILRTVIEFLAPDVDAEIARQGFNGAREALFPTDENGERVEAAPVAAPPGLPIGSRWLGKNYTESHDVVATIEKYDPAHNMLDWLGEPECCGRTTPEDFRLRFPVVAPPSLLPDVEETDEPAHKISAEHYAAIARDEDSDVAAPPVPVEHEPTESADMTQAKYWRRVELESAPESSAEIEALTEKLERASRLAVIGKLITVIRERDAALSQAESLTRAAPPEETGDPAPKASAEHSWDEFGSCLRCGVHNVLTNGPCPGAAPAVPVEAERSDRRLQSENASLRWLLGQMTELEGGSLPFDKYDCEHLNPYAKHPCRKDCMWCELEKAGQERDAALSQVDGLTKDNEKLAEVMAKEHARATEQAGSLVRVLRERDESNCQRNEFRDALAASNERAGRLEAERPHLLEGARLMLASHELGLVRDTAYGSALDRWLHAERARVAAPVATEEPNAVPSHRDTGGVGSGAGGDRTGPSSGGAVAERAIVVGSKWRRVVTMPDQDEFLRVIKLSESKWPVTDDHYKTTWNPTTFLRELEHVSDPPPTLALTSSPAIPDDYETALDDVDRETENFESHWAITSITERLREERKAKAVPDGSTVESTS